MERTGGFAARPFARTVSPASSHSDPPLPERASAEPPTASPGCPARRLLAHRLRRVRRWGALHVDDVSRSAQLKEVASPTGQLVALPVALGVTLLVLGCVLIRAGKKMERRRPFRRFGRARGEALRSQASTVARPTTPTS